MVYYDAYAIKALAQDAEKFVAFYQRWIEEVDIDAALNVLKISALYYQRFAAQPEEAYQRYFGRCIYPLLQRFPAHRERILHTERDCRLIHQAYNTFFRRITVLDKRYQKVTGGVNKLNAFLICSEINLSIMLSLIKPIPSARLEAIFPLVVRMAGLPLAEEVTPENTKAIDMLFDQVSSYTGHIFKQLRQSHTLDLEYQCTRESVAATGEWIKEWDDFDSLNRISDLFRFCQAEIIRVDARHISLQVDERCAYKAWEVARSRFTMRGINLYHDIQRRLKNQPDFVAQLKPVVPDWMSETDFFSVAYFSEMENMPPEDLYGEYGGVTIYAWIHAYEMLVTLAKQEMNARFQRQSPAGFTLKEWVIYRTRDEWIRLFAGGGLSWTSAALVTDYFTFDDSALDINDCPLLPCGDGLCLLPSIVSMSSATRSLLSLFSAKNLQLDDKGKSHERQFIQHVRDAGLRAAPLSVRQDYDCDCVLEIDDHLFFIELKSNGQPVHFNRYYQTLVNISGDGAGLREKCWIQQVTRYTDYYVARPQLIRDALHLPATWQPKGVHKLIVTTSMQGDIHHQNGCYVVDKSAFYSFIDRLPGVITEFKSGKPTPLQHEGSDYYHGEITIDKMLGFLTSLPSIALKRSRVQQRRYEVRCGALTLAYPFFDIWPAFERVVQEDGSEVVRML